MSKKVKFNYFPSWALTPHDQKWSKNGQNELSNFEKRPKGESNGEVRFALSLTENEILPKN